MDSISSFLPKELKKEKKRNEIFDEFLKILNPPRIEKGLKPISYGRLSKMLQHLDTWDKAIFLGSCKDSKNPSAYFWWALKVK